MKASAKLKLKNFGHALMRGLLFPIFLLLATGSKNKVDDKLVPTAIKMLDNLMGK